MSTSLRFVNCTICEKSHGLELNLFDVILLLLFLTIIFKSFSSVYYRSYTKNDILNSMILICNITESSE